MSRIILLDNFRGLAFIFMIIHHIFYFNDVSHDYKTSYANNIMVEISGTVARTLFVFLAGVSLSLISKSKNGITKRFKRSLEIAGHALIITAVTYYFYPQYFIRFGVLHFIALATFLLSFVAPYPKVTIILFVFSLLIQIPKINPFIDTITGASYNYQMMDWFPLQRWIPLMLLGLIFGQNFDLSKLHFHKFLMTENNLTKIGQNCLQLYTVHVVILIIFYYNLNKLNEIKLK
jgi:uncharacterized membrane protein